MAISNLANAQPLKQWDYFKYGFQTSVNNHLTQAKNLASGLKNTWNQFVDLPSTQYFVDQWAAPAANDAKSLVQNVSATVSPVLSSMAHDAKESLSDISAAVGNKNLSLSPAGSSGSTYSSAVPAQHAASTLNYVNADLAAHYGMDRKAAYSEALQNTAYQRAVADLKKAGLNPVLAASGLSPAGSYAAGNTLTSGSGSGSSGGYGNGNSGKRLFDSDTYNLIGVAGTLIGGVAGMVASPQAPVLGASTGAMLGKQITQSLAQAASSVANKRK